MVLIAQVISPIVHYMPEVDKGVDKCRETAMVIAGNA